MFNSLTKSLKGTQAVPDKKIEIKEVKVPVYRDVQEAQRIVHNMRQLFKQLTDLAKEAEKQNILVYLETIQEYSQYGNAFGSSRYEAKERTRNLSVYELKASSSFQVDL